MSNPNDGYAKRKEMSVQGLACTFTLSNMDAYFLVEDEKVSYKSKVVASGMMYRIFGQNTDILSVCGYYSLYSKQCDVL